MISCIFDTETTGLVLHPMAKLEVQPRVIEWAGVICNERGVILESMVHLINPRREISEEITKITGITNEMLVGKPYMEDVIDEIIAFMAKAGRLVAHNLPFDFSMMEIERQHTGKALPPFDEYICTVQEHEAEYGFRPKLTTVYEDYMGKPLQQTHRALDDVEALVEVCREAGVLR